MFNGAFDALLALSNGAVGQSNHQEVNALVYADFYRHGHSVDPAQGGRMQTNQHKGREGSGAVRLNVVNQGMDALDVNFLDAVSMAIPRHPDFGMAQPCECPSVFPGQPHDGKPLFSRRLCSFDHIGRVPRSGNGQQHIAALTHGLDITRKDSIETIVIAHASQVGRVRNGNGRKRAPVVPVAACKFFCEVHGITHRATVATRDDFTAPRDGLYHEDSSALQSVQLSILRQKVAKDLLGVFEVLPNVLGSFHGGKLREASEPATGVM